MADRRFSWGEMLALAGAALCSAALLVGALVAPWYSSTDSEVGPHGAQVSHSTATLVQENGAMVLGIVAVPLLVTAAIAIVLGTRRPGLGTPLLAWGLVALIGVLVVLGILAIGIFILPTALSLVAVCVLRERRRSLIAS
jgi:hypothetical protein